MSELKKLCTSYYEARCKGEYIDEDLEHYIFEAAMESVYGKSVWDDMKKGQRRAQAAKMRADAKKLMEEADAWA